MTLGAFTLQPLGDTAWLLGLGDTLDLATNRRVHAWAGHLRACAPPGITDIVPGYVTLTVHYLPEVLDTLTVRAWLAEQAALAPSALPQAPHVWELPTTYTGPDLSALAAWSGLSERDVIGLHSGTTYQVYMLGFAPGFAYLGEVPARIAMPRHATPRTHVPAGAVGIAGPQTGVYPQASPGGWQIIGFTSAWLFDINHTPPARLLPGDWVRFVPQ